MFPSIISTFNTVNPTDRLNSPSHSALHNSVSSVLTQVQTVIGVEGDNSVVGSLEYFIKSPASNGGGHVQTANKGGTGQTAFTKGDILVATSASVLVKLAVSSVTNNVLVVDPTQAAGIKWATNPNSNKIATSYMGVSRAGAIASAISTYYAASIAGSTLGTSNVVRFTGTAPIFNIANGQSFILDLQYGTQSILHGVSTPVGGTYTDSLFVEGMMMGIGQSSIYAYLKATTKSPTSLVAYVEGSVASAVDGSPNKTLFLNGQYSGNSNSNSVLTGLFVVEKIT